MSKLFSNTVATFVIFDRASSKQFNTGASTATHRTHMDTLWDRIHAKMLSTLHSSLDNTKNHIRNATINAKTTQQPTTMTTFYGKWGSFWPMMTFRTTMPMTMTMPMTLATTLQPAGRTTHYPLATVTVRIQDDSVCNKHSLAPPPLMHSTCMNSNAVEATKVLYLNFLNRIFEYAKTLSKNINNDHSNYQAGWPD